MSIEANEPVDHMQPEKTSHFLYVAANFAQLLAKGESEVAVAAARRQHDVAEKPRAAKAHLNLGRIGAQGTAT